MNLLWIDNIKDPVICKHHIRPSDLDSLGHINNSVALELFEVGRLQWSKINKFRCKENLIPVVTRLNVIYNREIFLEVVKIVTSLKKEHFFELQFKQTVFTKCMVSLEATVFLSLIDKKTKKAQRVKHCFYPVETIEN